MKVAGTIKVTKFLSADFEKGRLFGFCNPHAITRVLKSGRGRQKTRIRKRFEDAADFKDGKRPQVKE